MNRYIYSIADQKTSFCYLDTKDYDLQEKIDLEIKMREGTAKLLAACKHQNQCLEAAKSLLTSDLRLKEFRQELLKHKSATSNNTATVANNNNSTSASLSNPTNNHNHRNNNKINNAAANKNDQIPRAKASVSDIRIPLIWKDTDYFKNKGDYRRFAVFCLVKIGTEIYDTIMINVDRNTTDITFDDTFHFHNIEPDFEFNLFIYARILYDDLSMASTHKKFTHKISNSLSRSFGRKFIQNHLKDDFDPETGPKFYLIAQASLNLKDSADLIKTYDLIIDENLDKNLQLPFFGHFCCRLAVQPECLLKDYQCGIMKMIEPDLKSINGNGNNNNNGSDIYDGDDQNGPMKNSNFGDMYWAILSKFKLNLWSMRTELITDDNQQEQQQEILPFSKTKHPKRQPDLIIPINSHTKILRLKGLNGTANGNGSGSGSSFIQIINHTGGDNNCFTFECLNDQKKEWYKSLNRCRDDFKSWEPIAEYNMELAPINSSNSLHHLNNNNNHNNLNNNSNHYSSTTSRVPYHHQYSFSGVGQPPNRDGLQLYNDTPIQPVNFNSLRRQPLRGGNYHSKSFSNFLPMYNKNNNNTNNNNLNNPNQNHHDNNNTKMNRNHFSPIYGPTTAASSAANNPKQQQQQHY